MNTTKVDPDLTDMMAAVFAAHRTDHLVPAEPIEFDTELWKVLTELGLARLTGSESHGGSGADWYAAAALLAAAAVPVPLAEHDLLAGRLLETADLPMNPGLHSPVLLSRGRTAVAPWARSAAYLVALRDTGGGWAVAEVPADTATITPAVNIAGEPRDRVSIEVTEHRWTPVPDHTVTLYVLRGALARALQTCGALERITELSIEHACSREQFGRPLAKFQAVQQLVSRMAAETALARAATEAAVARAEQAGWRPDDISFPIAVAKSCTGHAVSTVVRNAHQVHGAIGTTYEHTLHRYAKPALAWRSEFGSVTRWDELLARTAAEAGRAGTWPLITDSRPVSDVLEVLR